MQRLQGESAREAGVQLFIIDRHGHAILSPAGVDGRVPVPCVAPHAGVGSVRVWGDGESYLSAAAAVQTHLAATQLGWTVVVRQPLALATAAANRARNTALWAAAVAAVLAGALAWLLAGRVSRPLQRIAAAAQALRAGRLETQIPRLAGTRELSELSETLRGMTAALLQRKAELAAANQGLEVRVQMRTAELLQTQQQLQAANAELEALARRDGLTGLHNRRSADERLAAEALRHHRSGNGWAVALIDIDHFKRVNDTHGHAAGDEVLRAVAHTLAGQVRQSDLVARHGGEEFLLLMPETGAEGAQTLCDKLRRAVAALQVALPEAPGRSLQVTVSIGLAAWQPVCDGPPADTAALLAEADRALYAAKQGGRNRVVYAEALLAVD
jgi:diguanylate cyclase